MWWRKKCSTFDVLESETLGGRGTGRRKQGDGRNGMVSSPPPLPIRLLSSFRVPTDGGVRVETEGTVLMKDAVRA